jgi:hypothetical protein
MQIGAHRHLLTCFSSQCTCKGNRTDWYMETYPRDSPHFQRCMYWNGKKSLVYPEKLYIGEMYRHKCHGEGYTRWRKTGEVWHSSEFISLSALPNPCQDQTKVFFQRARQPVIRKHTVRLPNCNWHVSMFVPSQTGISRPKKIKRVRMDCCLVEDPSTLTGRLWMTS